MERVREVLEQKCHLGKVLVDEVCEDLMLRKPSLGEFLQLIASLQVAKGVSEYQARVAGYHAYDIFTKEGVFGRDFLKGECLKSSEQSLSALSKLSLSQGSHSSGSSSGPPLIYQDKGLEAIHSPVRHESFPEPASDSVAAALWPFGMWKRVMADTGIKCEKKFCNLLARTREIHMRREDVKYLFVKGTAALVKPKTPDFFLVDKNYQDPPTAETVGGLLFTQSNTEATNSYCAATTVGEAIACGQVLLRTASQQRNFVLVGVTNLKAIRWFKVERPSVAGGFNGCQDAETSKTTHNLAGYMLCSADKLGLCVRSISTKMGSIRLGKWLGEGATSNVYDVCIGNKQYAVKVAKEGHGLTSDVDYLSKLEGIKGIPMICSAYSDPKAVFMTPVCQEFNIKLLDRKKLRQCLGDLVDTLQTVHGRLVVNRDIRMRNLMIAGDNIVIVDWGYAVPLQKIASFSGTTHFASDKVLGYLEEGCDDFAFDSSHDLVSLVRSLYFLSRLTPDVQMALEDIDLYDYKNIRRFWLEEFQDSKWWFMLEKLATEGRYSDLKNWLLEKGSCF